MRTTSIIALALCASSAGADERPAGWFGRAQPGFGYARDDGACAVAGRMFAGGFAVWRTVAPGVGVGVETGIRFNTVPGDPSCSEDLRLAFAMTAGPSVAWYPTARLHVLASAGYGEVSPTNTSDPVRGVGGTAAIGLDVWIRRARPPATDDLRVGVVGQVVWLRAGDHRIVSPALLIAIAFD